MEKYESMKKEKPELTQRVNGCNIRNKSSQGCYGGYAKLNEEAGYKKI